MQSCLVIRGNEIIHCKSDKVNFFFNTSEQNLHVKNILFFPNTLDDSDMFISVASIFRIHSSDNKLLIIFSAQQSPSVISSL